MPTGSPSSQIQRVGPTLWVVVTVRVAWNLMMAGVRVRAATLKDARDHVMLSLPAGLSSDQAEEMVGLLACEFLGRMKGEKIQRQVAEADLDFSVPTTWRTDLIRSVDPVGDAVLRLHYGDGMSMDDVGRTAAIGALVLSDARENIRKRVRDMARKEGTPLGGWSDGRIDQLIGRIANVPEPGCPEPMSILSDPYREHVDRCPRCSRAVRLIRGGMIAPSDLVQPTDHSLTLTDVAAIVLHPDARKVRRRLEKTLGPSALRAGSDAWLMSEQELRTVSTALRNLVVDGHLPRHHIRGAVIHGPGRWSGDVLLGPVAVSALESARSRPWSEVDTLSELPPPRPAPPSAWRWWLVAGLMAVGATIMGVKVFGPQQMRPQMPIEAEFTSVEDGWEIIFDAEDMAVIDFIAITENGPTLVHNDVRANRGQWATGEGNFRIYVPGTSVAIVASEDGLPDLEGLVKRSKLEPSPMISLEQWVRTAHPTVDWVGSPAITAEEGASVIAESVPTKP
jgi:hypothetical protein